MSTRAEPIDFNHEAAFRTRVGYQFAGSDLGGLFTYTHISADTQVDGALGGPGEFIVDPFGNLVGTVQVIDPADARGLGTVVSQGPFIGDRIRTYTNVELNVYDLDLFASLDIHNPMYGLALHAGIRLADVQQYYESVVEAGGVDIAQGNFAVEYFGVGPRIGFQGYRHFGERVSVFANLSGSLLVGTYDVAFQNSPLPGLSFAQGERAERTVPVMETELGVKVRVISTLDLSAGWMYQSWWDLGASGGTFGGWFSGADDSNIMAFDGFYLRAAYSF
jgi:hypothetical protein